jgi:CRP/FNR family nitrogen fixation transcriptional regulator
MNRISPTAITNPSHYRSLLASRPHPLKSLDSLATITPFHRGQEICSEGKVNEYWYCVVSGAARRSEIRADGRRQILDLLLPGDFFGLCSHNEYDYSVEAVSEGTIVAGYPRKRIEALADSDPRLAREIRQVAFDALSRQQVQLLILGRVTALEKVGSFILFMASRLAGEQGDSVALPISRYDMADYLAVSVETVSRSLTDLRQRGVIRLAGTRTVKIVNRNALEDGERLGYAA